MKTWKLSGVALSGALALSGCSGSSSSSTSGTTGTTGSTGTTGTTSSTGTHGSTTTSSSGSTGTTGSGANTIQVTFSGETLGVDGLPFNPSTAADADPWFVDGWTMNYSEILLSVGNVRLSPNATSNPDQSHIDAPVATKAGPFIVDMHKPVGLVGKDGSEPAQLIFTFDKKDDGSAFDSSQRYAFSYDTTPATAGATKVNLDSTQDADVALMVSKGWTKLYKGTVTWAGPAYTGPASAKFALFPTTIPFAFGFNDGAQNLNCANPDFGDGNTATNRGVQTTSSGPVVAQITLHVDHLFWDTVKQEGAPLRFDPIAAWAPTDGGSMTLLDLVGKPTDATFADGTPLPDRGTAESGAAYTSDQILPSQVSLNTNSVTTVTDLASFIVFAAQSQMHLNADGLCYIKGQYASDPYFQPHPN
jgi:hypothetical protein